ncbi:ATP-binding protein [Streptomyces lavendulae]|uniref:ATP-binding protein n=1 Tax=Streptomyces lavendulae TaxID=1914 RepID=UPI00369B76CE
MTSPRVPNTVCLGEALVPDRGTPSPCSDGRSGAELPQRKFRDGAEAVVWCARPAGPGSFRPEDARCVQDIRRFTTSHLRRWGAEEDVAQAAELVASELITNELRHGFSSSIRVRLIVGDGTFVVAVTGGGSYVPTSRMAAPDDIGKRGLFLVDHLARAHCGYWGVSTDGTTWCLLGSAALREAP